MVDGRAADGVVVLQPLALGGGEVDHQVDLLGADVVDHVWPVVLRKFTDKNRRDDTHRTQDTNQQGQTRERTLWVMVRVGDKTDEDMMKPPNTLAFAKHAVQRPKRSACQAKREA